MLVCLSVGTEQVTIAIPTLNWISELCGKVPHDLVLIVDKPIDPEVEKVASQIFKTATTYRIAECPFGKQWPHAANWAWQQTVKSIEAGKIGKGHDYWFWWEPDAIPIKADWLDRIEQVHRAGKHPISGAHLTGQNGPYVSGIAVYPRDVARLMMTAMKTRQSPFDIVGGVMDGTVRRSNQLHPTFVHVIPPDMHRTVFIGSFNKEVYISPETVLFHPNKDGSLINLLRTGKTLMIPGQYAPQKSKRANLVKVLEEWSRQGEYRPVYVKSQKVEPTFYHVLERHKSDDERVGEALASWIRLYRTGRMTPRPLWDYPRDSGAIGDNRCLPYLKDVLARPLSEANPDDLIVLTNDDTILHEQVMDGICEKMGHYDAISSHRLNFEEGQPYFERIPQGLRGREGQYTLKSDLGRDLFCFRAGWLKANFHRIPDFILGELEWDLVMAHMIRTEYGEPNERKDLPKPAACELPLGFVFHRKHKPKWMRPDLQFAPAKMHNLNLVHRYYTGE